MPKTLEITDEQRPNVPVAQVEEQEEEELQMSARSQQPDSAGPGSAAGSTQEVQTPTPAGVAGAGGDRGRGRDDEGPRGRGDDESQQPQGGTGPVGRGNRKVREGDCISSIAKQSGHFWETIWNDAGNSELKSVRKNPNVLLPDDQVTIPELKPKQETGETEQHHRFRRKGEPAIFRMRLMEPPEPDEDAGVEQGQEAQAAGDDFVGGDKEIEYGEQKEDKPRANVPYTLIIDGEHQEGSTDAEGKIEVPIPGNARGGKLILNPGTEDQEEIKVQLGHMGPITELSGVKQRLFNLSFDPGDFGDKMTPELASALSAFQKKHGLEETGEPDQATRDKLLELHGC